MSCTHTPCLPFWPEVVLSRRSSTGTGDACRLHATKPCPLRHTHRPPLSHTRFHLLYMLLAVHPIHPRQHQCITQADTPLTSPLPSPLQWLSHDLPLLRALQEALDADITARVGHLAEVNVPRYFITRAAVSLVPGAILAANMLSSMWRVGKMMELTGMTPDDPSSKTGKSYLQKLGVMSTAKVAAVESLGDVYQYAVYIWLAAAAADAAAGGASLAATLVDEVLLGSVVVLAGALSTFAAVYSRPLFVARAGEFLAMLQLIYLINPRMRRAGSAGCRVVEDGVAGCAEQEQQEGEGEEAEKVQQASRCGGTGPQHERVDVSGGDSSSRDRLLMMQMGPLRRRLAGRLRTFSCPGGGDPAAAAAAGGVHGLCGQQQAVGSSSSSSGQVRVHSAMAVDSAR
jgi:hypothetical protein